MHAAVDTDKRANKSPSNRSPCLYRQLVVLRKRQWVRCLPCQNSGCDSDHDELEGDLRERYPRSILRNYGLRGSRLARFWYLIRQFILMEWELSVMQGLWFSDVVFQRLGIPEVRLASTMNAG